MDRCCASKSNGLPYVSPEVRKVELLLFVVFIRLFIFIQLYNPSSGFLPNRKADLKLIHLTPSLVSDWRTVDDVHLPISDPN